MLNEIEHKQLVFVAARLQVAVERCCGLSESNLPDSNLPLCCFRDKELVDLICQRCHDEIVSGVWSVHSHGCCVMNNSEGKSHICLIDRYKSRLTQEDGFTMPYRNSLTPFEFDYAVYVAARRTQDLAICNEHFLTIIQRSCELCRQGIRAWLPDIHENGNCMGGCRDTQIQSELAKKCWAQRVPFWFMDGHRLSRDCEYV